MCAKVLYGVVSRARAAAYVLPHRLPPAFYSVGFHAHKNSRKHHSTVECDFPGMFANLNTSSYIKTKENNEFAGFLG